MLGGALGWPASETIRPPPPPEAMSMLSNFILPDGGSMGIILHSRIITTKHQLVSLFRGGGNLGGGLL